MGKLLIETVNDEHNHYDKSDVADVDSVVDCFNNLGLLETNKVYTSKTSERKESVSSEECNNSDADEVSTDLVKEGEHVDERAQSSSEPRAQDAAHESCDENASDAENGGDEDVEKTSAARREEHGSEDDEVEYSTRGPCKASPHFGGARYNPMMAVSDTGSSYLNYHLPLTPPYNQNFPAPDLSPPSPQLNFGDMSLNAPLTPETDSPHQHSPAYHGYGQPLSPGYAHPESLDSPLPDLSQYGGPADCGGYGAGQGDSPAYGYPSYEPLFPEDEAPSHLSTDYLATLQNVVARNTCSPSTSVSSPDNVAQVIASLRNITPGELDYIAPASPSAFDDIEAELALPSPSPCSSWAPSPASSSSSPSSSPDCREDAFPAHASWGARAVDAFRLRCDTEALAKAARNVATKRPEDLCAQDQDGDTVYMIVVCKPASSPGFYEKVWALQEALAVLRLCCGCGAQLWRGACGCGESEWRTPLSTANAAGDTALSLAVKMALPAEVVDYLLSGLARCPQDLAHALAPHRAFYGPLLDRYPRLARFL